jgi:O-antigen/teichoic acid export membrane protein
MKNPNAILSLEDPVIESPAPPAAAALTGGRLLARNAVWNLIGASSPILVALFCLPILKTKLGTDRLGIISLAWVVIGYFGLFDLGLSRALTKLVAERLGQRREDEIPGLVWTSLFLMAGLGAVGGIVVLFLAPWMVLHPLKVPVELRSEAIHAFYWIGFSIPIVIVTAGLRGVLEALQRFRLATAIRIPMGIFTYLGPVFVLPFSHSLVPIMAILVMARVVACVAHLLACFYALPSLRGHCAFHASSAGPLFRFGSWMTVSNLISPLMISCDRFLIGSMISVAAIAYYSVPYEVVTRLSLVPGALVGVLFPAFSTTAVSDRARLVFLFESGLKYIFLALFPITLILITFAPEALHFWLGAEFARQSAPVAQALGVAVFINGLTQIPFTHVQGAGRPDITAKLHLVELPFYVLMLVFFAKTMGIRGVAIAWLVRVGVDSILLFLFSWKLLPENKFMIRKLPLLAVGALTIFGIAVSLHGWPAKIIFVSAASLIVTAASWRWMLSTREKIALLGGLRGARAYN